MHPNADHPESQEQVPPQHYERFASLQLLQERAASPSAALRHHLGEVMARAASLRS
jgi:hypothetical protein